MRKLGSIALGFLLCTSAPLAAQITGRDLESVDQETWDKWDFNNDGFCRNKNIQAISPT